ncbi:hypothetical protein [Plantactinospora endophytica]|uniref:DUF4237 domain-containing protein n=1 Tax=Plantactinospora endophytica TaxID=673535 RepID=A0ABQ4DUU9_9ACTN|nr:hypothetical protein [Plantactinospora endophytica]GIG86208.1 hypothetical protein Pen02_11440 [Plantactinospora endophytica]
MGYETRFTGRVGISPPLNPAEIRYLTRFADVRHMDRTKGPYFVDGGGYAGQDVEPDVRDVGKPPPGQPGLWCQWIPSEDGATLGWDEEEKFYEAERWMAYLIDTFLRPGATLAGELAAPVAGRVYAEEFAGFSFDHVVDGVIEAEGEEPDDRWRLAVRDNVVYVVRHAVPPEYDEIDPADLGDWGDAQWSEFRARTRHNVAYVVRGGELVEVDPADGLSFAPVDGPDGG